MSAHTKGPLMVHSFPESMEHIISAPGWEGLAVVYGNEDADLNAQGEANAHLFAAAPDLLAALKQAKARLLALRDADVETVSMATAAIAKAEGRP